MSLTLNHKGLIFKLQSVGVVGKAFIPVSSVVPKVAPLADKNFIPSKFKEISESV